MIKNWQDVTRDLSRKSALAILWIGSAFIDVIFLLVWVFLQFAADGFISRLHLSWINHCVLVAFQILFAVSTLSPVVLYIYTDLRIMAQQAGAEIRKGGLQQ
jgi:hypothetical protein